MWFSQTWHFAWAPLIEKPMLLLFFHLHILCDFVGRKMFFKLQIKRIHRKIYLFVFFEHSKINYIWYLMAEQLQGGREKKYDQTDCELLTPKEMLTSNVKHNLKEEIVNRMPNHLNTVINHILQTVINLISFCLFFMIIFTFCTMITRPLRERMECSLSFVRSVYYGT